MILVELLLAFWAFVLGACVGSFLNVVVHRSPRGERLWKPSSRCPVCRRPIRPRDNIPILGWVLLGGRCRTCGVEISTRYPLVEAANGLLWCGLAVVEVLGQGINLPRSTPAMDWNGDWLLGRPPWELIGVWSYHCVLVSYLLCMTLIARDGMAIGVTLPSSGLVVGFFAPLAYPFLRPVHAVGSAPASAVGLLDGAVGLAVALLVSFPIGVGRGGPPLRRWDVTAVLLFAGVFLGWQAALTVAALSVVGFALARQNAWDHPDVRISIASTAVVTQLLCWRWISFF